MREARSLQAGVPRELPGRIRPKVEVTLPPQQRQVRSARRETPEQVEDSPQGAPWQEEVLQQPLAEPGTMMTHAETLSHSEI